MTGSRLEVMNMVVTRTNPDRKNFYELRFELHDEGPIEKSHPYIVRDWGKSIVGDWD